MPLIVAAPLAPQLAEFTGAGKGEVIPTGTLSAGPKQSWPAQAAIA